MKKCRICSAKTRKVFDHKVRGKYHADYLFCDNCGFLTANRPNWLKEAYKDPINKKDTGLVARNIDFSGMSAVLIRMFFNKKAKFLDYAGGYGLFSRLMRDKGIDFYWTDPYTENLFSKGFEYDGKDKMELLTCFECFEHLEHPTEGLEKMLKISRNILFSTQLLPEKVPLPDEWEYYGFSHGQHIAFYSEKTFRYLAKKHGLNYYKFGRLGLLTEKKINRPLALMALFAFYYAPKRIRGAFSRL